MLGVTLEVGTLELMLTRFAATVPNVCVYMPIRVAVLQTGIRHIPMQDRRVAASDVVRRVAFGAGQDPVRLRSPRHARHRLDFGGRLVRPGTLVVAAPAIRPYAVVQVLVGERNRRLRIVV